MNLKRRIEKIERQQRATAPKYSLEFDEDSLAIYEIQYYRQGTDTEHNAIAALPIGIRAIEVHDLVYGLRTTDTDA